MTAAQQIGAVVVAYNSADTIEGCLRSVPDHVPVVVVDNAPSHDSADRACRLGATVVANAHNAGFGRAVNQAVRLLDPACDAVLVLNPDARLRPGALAAMASVLEADLAVGIVGARLVRPDGADQRAVWPYPAPAQKWIEAAGLHRVGHHPVGGFVVGAALLIRRECWRAIGGFDELFWLYGEEADLCLRAEQAGWRVRHCDAAAVDHVGGHSGQGLDELVTEHFARGGERFVHKHHGPLGLLSYRLASIVDDAVRIAPLHLAMLLGGGDRFEPRLATRRRNLRRTARWLARRPFAIPAAVAPHGRQLIVLSLEAWDDVWRRNQFLVRELLAADPELRVLFVEPPLDPIHHLRRTRRLPAAIGRGLRPVENEPRVVRFRPMKWLPRVLFPRTDHQLAAQVRRAVTAAGFDRPTIWLNDTTYAPLLKGNLWPSLYDVTDDWLSARMSRRETRRRVRLEQRVLRRVDEVVVCSAELAARRGKRRPVELIPNGVDVAHFRAPHERPRSLAPGPVAVYVGTLHEDRLDVELLIELAAALPSLAIDLVGPIALDERNRARLVATGSIRLVGPVPYQSVPGYLQHADVIIVPHACNAFTESLDPIKAHECLAVSTPTVATLVPGFRERPEAFRLADRAGFAEAVRAALLAGPRSTAAHPTGWAERADAFGAVLRRAEQARRPKVAYIGHVARPSGGEIALERLLHALHGHVDAHVILAEDGPMVQRYRDAGACVEVLPLSGKVREVRKDDVGRGVPLTTILATAGYTVRLAQQLRRLEPDVVHTNTLKAAVYGGLAGRAAGVPVLWHIRDRIETDYLPAPAVYAIRLLGRFLPTLIVTNSEATRRTIASRRTSNPVPSPVVHDPSPWAPSERATRPLQRVGIVGRLAPWKGQDVFLRAFAAAFPDGDTEAVVVGGPLFGEEEYAEQLRQLVLDLRIDGRVTFTGHIDDVAGQLAGLDVLVHASRTPEPFGQVIVEGMAAGLPVVATRGGGPSEIIEHEASGILVQPDSVEELRAVLHRLATRPEERSRLADGGRSALDRYRPENVAAAMLSVYRSTLAANTGFTRCTDHRESGDSR